MVGEHNLTASEGKSKNAVFYPISRTIEHEKDNPMTLSNDIALVIVVQKIEFSQTIGPACLPDRIPDIVNDHVLVLGW
ncbi:trypsin-like serine protease, partial [Shewanella sp. C32]